MHVGMEEGIPVEVPNKLKCREPEILCLGSLKERVELLTSRNKIIISLLCGDLKSPPAQ